MRKIIASLDIGTSTIKLIIGEFIKNKLNILCTSEVPSKGMKKGLIYRRDELIPVLKETFHKAEEMLGIPVKEVVLSIPAYYTEARMSEGSSTITSEDHVITHQDLIRAMHAASYNQIGEDEELISILPTTYKIDNDIVKNPINMIGKKLSLKAVLITAPKSSVIDFLKVLDTIGIKVIDVVTSSLGDYASNRFKESGSKFGAIINIGEETTTVSIFNKGILTRAEVIELGGANIDNDIAYIYKITKKDARELKESVGLACSDQARKEEKVTLTDRLGEEVTINQLDLSEIIESRLREILELAKKQINLLTKREIEYIIITGGSSEIGDFNNLLDKVFTKPHILGKIDIVGARNNKFSTTLGIIKYYNGRLKLKNKEYSVFNLDELEILSGIHKKVSINENSILGKLFGYFFDS
ncbi:MAG TPA: cell division protein FtsA [Candidatus Caccenecus avistercoris]|nr:cell division protein FtsA [Candidatus Caccenecus avistercoris]